MTRVRPAATDIRSHGTSQQPLGSRRWTYDGATVEELLALATPRWRREHHLMLIADQITHAGPDRALLAVDIRREPGRCFRIIPEAAPLLEVNLALANVDFAEYATDLDPDGIHRGP